MTILFSYIRQGKTSKRGAPRKPGRNRCKLSCDKCKKEFNLFYDEVYDRESKTGLHLCQHCFRSHIQKNRSPEINKRISKSHLGKTMSKEHCLAISNSIKGEKHPNFGSGKWNGKNEKFNKHLEKWKGKSFKEIFGEEKALEISKKLTAARIGNKNPMYGKPSPTGSGNGWSGWYLGKYFRSLLELSFMIMYPNAKTAEKIRIKYRDHKNIERTYCPDFLLEDKIIEVKPKNLLKSRDNILKFEAANLCFGDKFIIFSEKDLNVLKINEIKFLVESGKIRFINRYKEKYEALF